jgi:hypothetical protein
MFLIFLSLLAVAALPVNAGSPEDIHECIRTLAIKFQEGELGEIENVLLFF